MPGLRLSSLGLDAVLALSNAPGGLRLAEIAFAVAAPVSSIQRVLGTFVAHGLAARDDRRPPVYRLDPEHPAHEEIARLAAVLPEPAHALGIVLRANPAVTFASYDGMGFIVAVADTPPAAAVASLDENVALIAGARSTTPALYRVGAGELGRLLGVALELRLRVRRGLVVKGVVPRLPAVVGARRNSRQAG